MSMKNSIDTIGNRNRDIPTCSPGEYSSVATNYEVRLVSEFWRTEEPLASARERTMIPRSRPVI